MATKFFLTSTASDVNPGTDLEKLASLTAGSSLATSTTNTATSPSPPIKATDTAGGSILFWLTNPLNAVTLTGSSTVTCNIWVAENNMSANAGGFFSVFKCNNDGTQVSQIDNGGSLTAEFAVTTRAAVQFNYSLTASPGSLTAGQRLGFYVQFGNYNAGTMATGFTVSLGYSGPTAAADGDSWFQLADTFTERVVYVPRNPAVNHQNPGLLARRFMEEVQRRYWRPGWSRRPSGVLVPA